MKSINNANQTPTSILRRKQVEERTGLSRASVYAKMKFNPKRPSDYDPTFPKPIRISAKSVGWVSSEIEQWLQVRIEESRKAANNSGETESHKRAICKSAK